MGRSDGEICGDGTHLEHHGERCAHCSRCCGVGGAPLVKESGRVITQLTGARLGRIIDRDGPEGSAMGVSSGGGGEGGVGRGRREEGSREEVEQEGGEGLEGAALEEEASSVGGHATVLVQALGGGLHEARLSVVGSRVGGERGGGRRGGEW